MHGQRFLHGTECVLRKRVLQLTFGNADLYVCEARSVSSASVFRQQCRGVVLLGHLRA